MGKIGSVLLLLFAGIFALFSCSLSDRTAIQFRVAPGLLPTTSPHGRAAYSCYLVYASGPGITPTVGSKNIGSFAPECVNPGVSSAMVSLETIQTQGVTLKIPSGSQRKIEVLGVVTTISGPCAEQPIEKLFENGKIPELFSLATATGQDIYNDKKVTLHPPANATPQNILAGCFQQSSTRPVSAISAVRLVTRHQNSVQNSLLNTTTGEITTVADDNILTNNISHLFATPDYSRLLGWRSIDGLSFPMIVVQPGKLVLGSAFLNSANHFGLATTVLFSQDSRFGFLPRYNSFASIKATTAGFQGNSEYFPFSGDTIKSTEPLFSMGSYFYQFTFTSPSVAKLVKLFIPADGALPLSMNFVDSNIFLPSATFISDGIIVRPEGLYVTYSDGLNIQTDFYHQKPDGDFVKVNGSIAVVGAAANTSSTRLALSPTLNFLFVMTVGGQIKSYVINSNGSVGTQTLLNQSTSYFKAFAVDPTGKFLVIAEDAISTSYLSAPRITPGGFLDVAAGGISSGTGPLPASINSVIPIALY